MVSTFEGELLEWESNCGEFRYLAGFLGCSALVSTLEFCSVLGYIYLWLIVKFEVMGCELVGWFFGTFRRAYCRTNICIWPNVQLGIPSLIIWFTVCHMKSAYIGKR